MTARDPLRRVTKASQKAGGLIMMQRAGGGPKCRWWELTLECGHTVERGVRYNQPPGSVRRGWALIHHPPPHDQMRPAPTRVRCHYCKRGSES